MTKETMTVHKALCELKTLEDRIIKAMNECTYVVANKHSNTKIGGLTIEMYKELVKSSYQKTTDLIKRRNAIKCAVVKSNATTTLTIDGTEYTVAEAIDMKNCGIELTEQLRDKMEKDLAKAIRDADKNNGKELEKRADEYIKTLYGATEAKNMSDDIKKTHADFISAQTYEIVDALGIQKVIDELEEKNIAFMIEVDSALSVSNALTTIEIEY